MKRGTPCVRRLVVGLFVGLLLTGCGGGGTDPESTAGKLAFLVQPTDAGLNATLSPAVQIVIQDASGSTVTTATDPVTFVIGTNPSGGGLSGTTTTNAVGGIASFPDLEIDRSGTGYTLVATSAGLASATSAPFNVVFSFQAVSTGSQYACGVTTAGEAYCWGNGGAGRRGDGTMTDSATPVAVAGSLTFESISTGFDHTCGVTPAGVAYCWGANLGNGTNSSSATPVAVAGGLTFQSVSNGIFHSCGLTTGGEAYCWGSNDFGQFGDGTTNGSNVPVPVAGGLTFKSMSADGGNHTCGITDADITYCWGTNDVGELGNGTTTGSTTPVAVTGGLTFQSISAGNSQTCGLTTVGEAYCWGRNDNGQLGDGTTTSRTVPVVVVGGLTFQSVGTGSGHSRGITTAGAAYCWGTNASGELGNGSPPQFETAPAAVLGGLVFVSVSARAPDFTCGVTVDGPAYCWGSGSSGRLGNGLTTGESTPVRVVDP